VTPRHTAPSMCHAPVAAERSIRDVQQLAAPMDASAHSWGYESIRPSWARLPTKHKPGGAMERSVSARSTLSQRDSKIGVPSFDEALDEALVEAQAEAMPERNPV
jgi:hypothetical protein